MLNFKGVFSALVTPFHQTGEVDYDSFKKLLDHQKNGGISGVVVSGTTGESPTITNEEFERLVTIAKEALFETKMPLIVGTGTNSTTESVKKSKRAKELGADALLVVTPYYNKPSQEGLFNHFSAIATAVAPLPIILYDVPGRTGIRFETETVKRLALAHKNVIGIKDATGDLSRISIFKTEISKDFLVLSGDDPLFLASLSVGADGIISVASNLIPREMMQLLKERSVELNNRLLPFFNGIFIESNPTPIKMALAKRGVIASNTVRGPLTKLKVENEVKLLDIMKKGMI